MKKLLITLLVAVFCLQAGMGCAHKKRLMYEPSAIAVRSKDIGVKRSIRTALADLGWMIERDTPGEMIVRQVRGAFQARLKITYSDRNVNLTYLDSENLNYNFENGEKHIHGRYNTWLQNLERRIAGLVG